MQKILISVIAATAIACLGCGGANQAKQAADSPPAAQTGKVVPPSGKARVSKIDKETSAANKEEALEKRQAFFDQYEKNVKLQHEMSEQNREKN